MARKAKKLTPNQQAYKKEVARIKRSMRNIEKRDYFFTELPNLELPKRVTKQALQRLQNTKAKDLYNLAVKVNKETGEFIPGVEARKLEYQERAKKRKKPTHPYTPLSDYTPEPIDSFPDFSDIVIANFRSDIANFPDEIKNIFFNWLDEISEIYTPNQIAQLLEEGKNKGLIVYREIYNAQGAHASIVGLTNMLPNMTQERKQKIFDGFDDITEWDDIE